MGCEMNIIFRKNVKS